jgi:hypothetical protein
VRVDFCVFDTAIMMAMIITSSTTTCDVVQCCSLPAARAGGDLLLRCLIMFVGVEEKI